MKTVVIKVKHDGKTQYVKRASCHEREPLTDCIFTAKHYNLPKEDYKLKLDLSGCNYPEKDYTCRSGINLDSKPEVVCVKFYFEEVGLVDEYK